MEGQHSCCDEKFCLAFSKELYPTWKANSWRARGSTIEVMATARPSCVLVSKLRVWSPNSISSTPGQAIWSGCVVGHDEHEGHNSKAKMMLTLPESMV